MKKNRILSLLAVIIIAMSLVTFALASEPVVAAEQAVDQPWYAGIIQFLPIIIIFVVFYFVLIRPENKRKKETAKMRDNVAVGDEITTIGGIVGKVTTVRDDQIIIKTSNEENKIRLMKWAISTVNKESNSAEESK